MSKRKSGNRGMNSKLFCLWVGLAAKPIIDVLVEVVDLKETRKRIVPVLEAQRYVYFWRPTCGDGIPPFYAWFIKRDYQGNRTHHIHMVERNFEHWDRLLFRDYLIEHSGTAKKYQDFEDQSVQQISK